MENNNIQKREMEQRYYSGKEMQRTSGKGSLGKLLSYVFLGIAIIYAVSPIDIVPDVPVVGWFDDLIVLASTGLNVIQKHLETSNATLDAILRTINRGCMILGIIAIVVLGMFGLLIYKVFFQ